MKGNEIMIYYVKPNSINYKYIDPLCYTNYSWTNVEFCRFDYPCLADCSRMFAYCITKDIIPTPNPFGVANNFNLCNLCD